MIISTAWVSKNVINDRVMENDDEWRLKQMELVLYSRWSRYIKIKWAKLIRFGGVKWSRCLMFLFIYPR